MPFTMAPRVTSVRYGLGGLDVKYSERSSERYGGGSCRSWSEDDVHPASSRSTKGTGHRPGRDRHMTASFLQEGPRARLAGASRSVRDLSVTRSPNAVNGAKYIM